LFQKVLILAPHTDDGEFGCGGTIAKFVQAGKTVYYVALSSAEKSVPDSLPKNILRREVEEATAVLGIKRENLFLYNYGVRDFPAHRQGILEDLVVLKNLLKPDLVLLPSLEDLHQDHRTVANEGIRAFKNTTILGYEIPWNNLSFSTHCFIRLGEEHLKEKINALNCYHSQSHRYYASGDFIRSLARTRGTQIGTEYAEGFEVIRLFLD
jgi:LmbE family N-acetylglucosaminyl deacetylase